MGVAGGPATAQATLLGQEDGFGRRDPEQAGKLAALRRSLDEAEATGVSPRSAGEVFAETRAAARARDLRG